MAAIRREAAGSEALTRNQYYEESGINSAAASSAGGTVSLIIM